jgi:hypothetical protein
VERRGGRKVLGTSKYITIFVSKKFSVNVGPLVGSSSLSLLRYRPTTSNSNTAVLTYYSSNNDYLPYEEEGNDCRSS